MSRVVVMAENTLILTEKRVMSRAVDCIGCIKIFEVVSHISVCCSTGEAACARGMGCRWLEFIPNTSPGM